MKTKEIKIRVPKGYEIDKENSTFECIKFKPKKSNFKNIIEELRKQFYIFRQSVTLEYSYDFFYSNDEQLKKLQAINQLMLVAKYLNNGWKPDWSDPTEGKYYIYCHNYVDLHIIELSNIQYTCPVFKSKELAQQAIDILGEQTIKDALSMDY